MPKFIAIEGADRTGKQTQSMRLCRYLSDQQHQHVKYVEVPWDNHFTHKIIHDMLQDGSAIRHPNLFQIAQGINKHACQLHCEIYWKNYDYVVFDRWRLSMRVYGEATGANKTLTHLLSRCLIEPHATIVLSNDYVSDEREDCFETDHELQRKVRSLYNYRSTTDEKNCVVVDIVGKSIDDVHDIIVGELKNKRIIAKG